MHGRTWKGRQRITRKCGARTLRDLCSQRMTEFYTYVFLQNAEFGSNIHKSEQMC